jgi:hopanoid biosynthesis associated protein HpnK
MVAGAAAADALVRSRRLPNLRVGLHLALVEAEPVLDRDAIAALVQPDGRLRTDMAALSLRLALSAKVRRQLAAEIAAQFEAYRKTGLGLDHVNGHKHFHINPLVAGAVLRIGHEHGMRALRVPREPAGMLRSLEPDGLVAGLAGDAVAGLLARRLARLARRAGLVVTDRVFGLRWTGAMTAGRIAKLVAALPAGSTEIYAHPATADGFAGSAPGYRYRDELAALTEPGVIEAMRRSGATLGGYADLPRV